MIRLPFQPALAISLALWLAASPGRAQTPAPPAEPALPPTLANVSYGSDPSQVIDFYRAPASSPTPLVIFIHGGGWVSGTKSIIPHLQTLLDAGISVASVEYRFLQKAMAAGVHPPVRWPLGDAARAVQFIRTKAGEWNFDKKRIAASGGSAGACSSLWLAFHDDLAVPGSPDPVSRESTRLFTAAVTGAQTSLDPAQLQRWTPNSRYGGHAFGLFDPADLKTRDTRFAEFLARRDALLPEIRQYSPIEHVTADDPAVYLQYSAAPAMGQEQADPTHTANYGVGLQEVCRRAGTVCLLQYPGAQGVEDADVAAYLIRTLKSGR
ncbi:MAG: alpha/beta hydrolase [Verrucomicrobia bacterium]|nr:alpha/beta hydrolase [Verrucomicrobiota bacterium]